MAKLLTLKAGTRDYEPQFAVRGREEEEEEHRENVTLRYEM
jgi:hypothetical protein